MLFELAILAVPARFAVGVGVHRARQPAAADQHRARPARDDR
jgi:hypothetical protein